MRLTGKGEFKCEDRDGRCGTFHAMRADVPEKNVFRQADGKLEVLCDFHMVAARLEKLAREQLSGSSARTPSSPTRRPAPIRPEPGEKHHDPLDGWCGE